MILLVSTSLSTMPVNAFLVKRPWAAMIVKGEKTPGVDGDVNHEGWLLLNLGHPHQDSLGKSQ